ncbi:aldo/keto reductase [Sinomonas sp. RB5]
MKTRSLPGTGLELTELGFGAASIGNLYRQTTEEEAAAAVQTAWDCGIRYFDVAPHYGLGLAERRLGAALAHHARGDYILSTKVGRLLRPNPHPVGRDPEGFDVPDDLTRVRDYSREGVLRSIEESLERLGTDRIDIVYIHDPDEHWAEALEGAVPTLSALRGQGVIGAYGAGMNQAEMLCRFVNETDVDVVMLAGRYTLLEQGASSELIPACLERKVGIVDVGVFNSGLLSRQRPAPGTTYDYHPAPAGLIARATRLAEICEAHGTSLPAAAIAFPLQCPAVVNVTLGMRTREHVKRNAELAAQTIPVSLWEDLRAEGLIPSPAPDPNHTF